MREGSRLPQPKKCDIGPASPAIPSCQMGMHRARNRNNGGSLSKLPHASKGREHFSENFKVLPNRQRPNLYQNLEAFLLSEPGQHTSRLFCIRVGIFQIKTLKHRATTRHKNAHLPCKRGSSEQDQPRFNFLLSCHSSACMRVWLQGTWWVHALQDFPKRTPK